jgi:hypothetical protein
MMTKTKEPYFGEAELSGLAKVLEGSVTHAELTQLLREAKIEEASDTTNLAKWQRIYNAVGAKQGLTQTGNYAMLLTRLVLAPRRFVGRAAEYDKQRACANSLLAFRGWRLKDNGKFERVERVRVRSRTQKRGQTVFARNLCVALFYPDVGQRRRATIRPLDDAGVQRRKHFPRQR